MLRSLGKPASPSPSLWLLYFLLWRESVQWRKKEKEREGHEREEEEREREREKEEEEPTKIRQPRGSIFILYYNTIL